ncbi:MAG: PadR family transcriptional regulator [Micrococcales bacterium]
MSGQFLSRSAIAGMHASASAGWIRGGIRIGRQRFSLRQITYKEVTMINTLAEDAATLFNNLRKSIEARFDNTDAPRAAFAPERTEVELAVLTLLSHGPRSGGDVVAELGALSAGGWTPRESEVFPILESAREAGRVEFTTKKSKKVFSLTPAGEAWLQEAQKLAASARTDAAEDAVAGSSKPGRHTERAEAKLEFARSAAALGQVLGSVTVAGDAGTFSAVKKVLDEATKSIHRLLGESK